jgi:hypothetical protein
MLQSLTFCHRKCSAVDVVVVVVVVVAAAAGLKKIGHLKDCFDEDTESVTAGKKRWRDVCQTFEFGREEFVVVLELLQGLCHEVKYLQRMKWMMRMKILLFVSSFVDVKRV